MGGQLPVLAAGLILAGGPAHRDPLAPLHGEGFPVLVQASASCTASAGGPFPTRTVVRLLGWSTAGRIALLTEDRPGGFDGPEEADLYQEVDLASDRILRSEETEVLEKSETPGEARTRRAFVERIRSRLTRFPPAPAVRLEPFPAKAGYQAELRPLPQAEREDPSRELFLLGPAGWKRIAGLVDDSGTGDRPPVVSGWLADRFSPRIVVVIRQEKFGGEGCDWQRFSFHGARLDSGFHAEGTEGAERLRELNARGMKAYRAGDWDQARETFQQALGESGGEEAKEVALLQYNLASTYGAGRKHGKNCTDGWFQSEMVGALSAALQADPSRRARARVDPDLEELKGTVFWLTRVEGLRFDREPAKILTGVGTWTIYSPVRFGSREAVFHADGTFETDAADGDGDFEAAPPTRRGRWSLKDGRVEWEVSRPGRPTLHGPATLGERGLDLGPLGQGYQDDMAAPECAAD